MTTTAPRLEDALRVHLSPVLRREGFAGSGRTFRRIVGESVHVVNVQGFHFGGRFAVNLAVHPLGLPYVATNVVANPKKITEVQCEFRTRLTEGPAGRVWDHDGTGQGMSTAVKDAAAVYEHYGRAFFLAFVGPDSDFRTFQFAELEQSRGSLLARHILHSKFRLAYTFARLRALEGKREEAAAFASWALSHGGASPFPGHHELLELANDA